MHLVEERTNYASSVGLKAAMQHTYEANDEAVGIFARNHDICEAAVALSADIARVWYPFRYIKAENADARFASTPVFVASQHEKGPPSESLINDHHLWQMRISLRCLLRLLHPWEQGSHLFS